MQGVQALKHILQSGRKASDVREPSRGSLSSAPFSDISQVIIGGDSAGGHLALGVIAASIHSHDGIPALELGSPLRGAILISPWTSFSADTRSYHDNIDKDIVTVDGMVIMRDEFVSSLSKDDFAEPAQTDAKWWANAPVNSVINLAGTHELFFDHIMDLGVKLKEAGLNVQTVECAQQVHVDCILDAQTGFEPGPMSLALWDWLEEAL
jgi:acetyl esterase/lipase